MGRGSATLRGWLLGLCMGCRAESSPAVAESVTPGVGSPARLIAMGDVHGDLDAAIDALMAAGVVDEEGRWVGGSVRVVQVGDQLDRGNQERALLAWFDRLTEEAEAAGGSFRPLIGNHETMNVALDPRYVTPGGFADYADLASELSEPLRSTIRPDAQGRVAAFRPGGVEALRLAAHPVIAIDSGMLFAHGGVLPVHLEEGIDAINREVSDWMRGDRPDAPSISGPDSPVWTRAYSQDPDDGDCEDARRVLDTLGLERMIVAHTVQEEGIASACGGRVWRVDVGLSRHYGGPIQVLEFGSGDPTVRAGSRRKSAW